MKFLLFSFYDLVLALWVGGMAIFTLIITPAIFRSFARDRAGELVGKLFPGYFLYNLVLSALAFVLFFVIAEDRSTTAYRLSFFLVAAAVMVNAFILYELHPETVRIKREVTSFERELRDSPARKKFARLHALSASLNLMILADGVALFLLSPFLGK